MALIAHFKSAKYEVPAAVTSATAKPAVKRGFVTSGFERGMVLLRNHKGEYYRLSWNEGKQKKKPVKDLRRPLPVGAYQLKTYRIHQRDNKGDDWFVSVTNPHRRKFGVHREHKTPLKLTSEIHLHFLAKIKGDTLQVSAMVMDKQHGGLSIYHKGKRIPLNYRVEDSTGNTLARGTLKYG